MHLFGHHHDATNPPGSPATPPPRPPATTQGWQAVDGRPFLPRIHDLVHDATRAMYGHPRWSDTPSMGIGETIYRDAFRGTFDGRTIVVANALTPMDPGLFQRDRSTPAVAVAAAEVPTMLMPLCVQSRQFMDVLRMRELPTGDPMFDERFRVVGADESLALLTDPVRWCIAPHADWVLWLSETFVVSVSKGGYESSDEMNRRVGDMLTLVSALPESIVPRQVDHSADDLAARIDRIGSVEDAFAFLQALTPADRERLARSNTPLAAFADVRTPDEAMARMMSLDVPSRMQLMAVFSRVRDN